MVKSYEITSDLDRKLTSRIIDHINSKQLQSKYEDIDSLTRSLPAYLKD